MSSKTDSFRRYQARFAWTVVYEPYFSFFGGTFNFSEKNGFLEAIVGNICLRIARADEFPKQMLD